MRTVWDHEAVAQSKRLLETHLSPLDLLGFDSPLVPVGGPPALEQQHRLAYRDALIDLSHLAAEIRFEIAMACLIIWDFRFRLQRGEVRENDPLGSTRERLGIERPVPLPAEVLTFLAIEGVDPPSPDEFFADPHKHFGLRVLGLWFAGQLLDSALFRGVAALDRVITMLWCRAELPLPSRSGRDYRPAFTDRYVDDADFAGFLGQEGRDRIRAIRDHELFVATRELRNGFAHSRRGHFETGGEILVVYETEAERVVVQGGSPEAQINLSVGLYALLLRPLVDISRELVQRAGGPAQ